ncbi:MAG TPA: PilT/PilU family type 4a pilus ATPase [Thermoanaerobaculia bacterium]|nr:PilT/PilU family type 4a pilus ATPase [Thermoanaerobaculia bacterium]
MVLEKLRKGLRSEPPWVTQLREHRWISDVQRKELLDRFVGMSAPEVEWVTWTALEPSPDIRAAGISILRRRTDREAYHALAALLHTHSEAARRAVIRFLKDLAGADLGPVLLELASLSNERGRLAGLELAPGLPGETAFEVARRTLQAPSPGVRARALRLVSETDFPGGSGAAARLALPLLQDENSEIRLAALAVLERHPSESSFPDLLQMARTGDDRVMQAAFAALVRLLPAAKQDHTPEIVPLLADGHPAVRAGALSLLQGVSPETVARRFVEHFHGAFVWVRDRALDATREGLKEFCPALIALCGDPEPTLAKAAAEMTLALEDPRALPIWLRLTEDTDYWVRARAMELLGQHGHGHPEVLPRLLSGLESPDVAIPASAALGELGDPRAAAPLLEAFKKAQPRPDVQIELLDGLAALARVEPRIVPLLGKVAQTPQVDAKVREKARRCVERIENAAEGLPSEIDEDGADLLPLPEGEAGLREMLAEAVRLGASDFHLATGFLPHRRIQGRLEPVDMPVITRKQAQTLIRQVLSEEQWRHLEKERHLDVALRIPRVGRFRANFFSQRSGFDASFRVISRVIPKIEDLGLPASAEEILRFTQGLVLVTGPAGCGKSTTLAAMIERLNEVRPCHIITIEDPVEYVFLPKMALVNQRQVPRDTRSFARALRAALREDPDVIMVGELRDLETISLAVTAAETGHLVFGTLHTSHATATIDRMISTFPPGQQDQIRVMLADSLKAVVSQLLLPRRDGQGRVAAFEILRTTQAIGALIREGKTFQIPSLVQTGKLHGMVTMDQSLLQLCENELVEPEVAIEKALKTETFEPLVVERRKELE